MVVRTELGGIRPFKGYGFVKSMKTPVLSFRPEGGILILQSLMRSLSIVRDDNRDFLRDPQQ
jgi:hypothetical protein